MMVFRRLKQPIEIYPELEEKSSFVGRWMDILRPGFERLPQGDDTMRQNTLEKEAVLVSLENLMSFPFVKSAVDANEVMLHGVWHDIGEGDLETYDPQTETFVKI